MVLGSQRATSVTFEYPRGVGHAPVAKLPRHWYATIGWGDGSKDEVWFCHHAEEWQAERDALPGGNRKVPVWNPPGSGEGVGSGSFPGWTPARRGGVGPWSLPTGTQISHMPPSPVYWANKAIVDIFPTAYECGQMTISGTTWSWNQ